MLGATLASIFTVVGTEEDVIFIIGHSVVVNCLQDVRLCPIFLIEQSMEKFDSITHFLQSGSFNYRVFDMGRKVTAITNDDFHKIEDQQDVYPFPFQQKVWLALLFWKNNAEDDAVIWFLQFPIDELGFLKQESRDHFLIDLLEQAGKNIQAKQVGDATLDELGESPFAFKPPPDRLAMFHALAGKALKREPSQYYQHVREYLQGKLGYDQWQFLGLQGIADVAARLEEKGSDSDKESNAVLLQKAFSQMPEEPLLNFSYALENVIPQGGLTVSLFARLNQELELGASGNVAIVAALIRALSASQPETARKEFLSNVLSTLFASEIEVLAAISGRAWKDLASLDLLSAFVGRLADQDQAAFNAILADLMMIPGMREPVLAIMRSPERTDALGEKLTGFMSVLRGG